MPETHIFNIIAKNYYSAIRSNKPFIKLNYDNLISFMTYKRVIKFLKKNSNFYISKEDNKLLEKNIQFNKLTISKFVSFIFNQYNKNNDYICIEKTPSHIFCTHIINQTFKNNLIIAIIRDPRDSFISFNSLLTSERIFSILIS